MLQLYISLTTYRVPRSQLLTISSPVYITHSLTKITSSSVYITQCVPHTRSQLLTQVPLLCTAVSRKVIPQSRARQCQKVLWVMGVHGPWLRLQVFLRHKGNSTNKWIHALSFLVGKHCEPQSMKAKLFLPILPIGIVAFAFTLLWQPLLKQPRVFESGRLLEEKILHARTVLSPRFLYYSIISNEGRYLAMWTWLSEDELKVKIAHFRLPSGSQKRACLRSFHWNRTYTEIFLKLFQLIVYIIWT